MSVGKLTSNPQGCVDANRWALERLAELGAKVVYQPHFLSPAEGSEVLTRLLADIEWNSDEESSVRRPYSRERIRIPRQQAAYGEPGTSYAFSGCVVWARPWIPSLVELRDLLRARTGFEANFVLINHYRNGADYLGWHSDDERDMGEEPELYSLSLGATRDFQLRCRPARGDDASPKPRAVTLELAGGSLLHMQHPTNRDFKHQLPKRGGKRPDSIGPRLNLTWRRIVCA